MTYMMPQPGISGKSDGISVDASDDQDADCLRNMDNAWHDLLQQRLRCDKHGSLMAEGRQTDTGRCSQPANTKHLKHLRNQQEAGDASDSWSA